MWGNANVPLKTNAAKPGGQRSSVFQSLSFRTSLGKTRENFEYRKNRSSHKVKKLKQLKNLKIWSAI